MFLEKKNLRNLDRWNFKTTDRIGKYLRLDRNEKVEKLDNKIFRKIIGSIKNEYLTAYPETTEFQDLVAKKNRLKFDEVLITTGSDTAIRHVFETFIEPNDKILTLDNTYAMYPVYAKMMGAKVNIINYNEKFEIDIDKLLKSTKSIKMLVIANPNLSGQVIKNEHLFKILKYSRGKFLVLIDECYFGFYKSSQIRNINKFNNLIVTRSFSKTYGIPGLRIGAAFSCKEIINKLNKVRLTHAISAPASLIGKTLIKDKNYFKKNIKNILNGKKYLIDFLKIKKIKYLNTHTNFIYIKFDSFEVTKNMISELKKNKILVKGPYVKFPFVNMIRVTIGVKKTMRKFVNGFAKAYNKIH